MYIFVYTTTIKGVLKIKFSIMTISERIRLTRQQKSMSQKELAELSEVNIKSLSRYEIGTSIPPADVIKKLADALKVSTDTLLSDDNISIKDKELLKKFETLQDMTGETKRTVINLIDLAIRDFKAKQAYSS